MKRFRLPGEAQIDRSCPLAFTFNGRRYSGFRGDTLASALLANGVRIVGRSFKRHRPRGVFSAGIEEPNALVTFGVGAYREINMWSTTIPLYEGLTARSQRGWPTTDFDLGSVLVLFGRLLPAGFYYKTFKWPSWSWYEGLVRRLAGPSRISDTSDPDRYTTRFHHTDVLIIGAGPAGLAAARVAVALNREVVLIDNGEAFGGSLLAEPSHLAGVPAWRWAADRQRELRAMPRVHLLPRTMALGCYEGNLVAAVERIPNGDHESPSSERRPRQRLWKIRAARIVLATGAIERSLVFENNDRPGILLASAVRSYVVRYAVSPGSLAVIFTNNDSAYDTAFALHDRGVHVAAIVDVRTQPGTALSERVRRAGITLHVQSVVINTRGRRAIRSVEIARCTPDGTQLLPGGRRTIRCDLLCVSGGWDPQVHLFAQAGGKLRFDTLTASFIPVDDGQLTVECIGAAKGEFDLGTCLEARPHLGSFLPSVGVRATPSDSAPIQAMWRVPDRRAGDRHHHQWVDLAHDVTVGDIELAAREGFRSVEHMKRYTTAGMAIDQGKTSNVSALALLGQVTGRTPAEVGTTTYRPPYCPVAVGALAGARVDDLAQRFRRLPVHWHEEHGALLEDHSGWLRPAYYPRPGETEEEAIAREVLAGRRGVALFDSSSLGKFEVRGRDAAEFLNRLYVNNVKTLQPGRLRYGLMLNDHGIIMDDGILACLGGGRYLVNTSSAGALQVSFWMEQWLQCEWRSLQVWIDRQTAQWATLTLLGPQARAVLAKLGLSLDVSAHEFPHMHVRETVLDGTTVRVRRASFTGELSFELDVAADLGNACWDRLMKLGEEFLITPLGMEALDVLRVEKGFLEVGTDTDGVTSPIDVGWGAAIAKKSDDFIGRRSLECPAMQSPSRLQLVGLLTEDPALRVPVGTHVVGPTGEVEGHVTSSCLSPHLARSLVLAQVRSGRARKGQSVCLDIEGHQFEARISDSAFYDPHGERLNG
jgi:sarcosine oxidase, subunit alpha